MTENRKIEASVIGRQKAIIVNEVEQTSKTLMIASAQMTGPYAGVAVQLSGAYAKIVAHLAGSNITAVARPVDGKEKYTGSYIIEPSMDDQVLNTKNKVMTDDLTIKKIMVTFTSNLSGGNTVYIGAQGV